MDFLSIAKKRCSVRSYTRQPVHLIVVQHEEDNGKCSPEQKMQGCK